MTEIEKERVRAKIEKYLEGKKGYDLEEFGDCKKVKLGGATWIYVVEVRMEGWDEYNYALVPVVRANPLGCIMLSSSQLARVIEAMIDGLDEPFC